MLKLEGDRTMNILEELEQLRDEMQKYTKYLKEETYSPYERVEEFTRRLKKIIDAYENE